MARPDSAVSQLCGIKTQEYERHGQNTVLFDVSITQEYERHGQNTVLFDVSITQEYERHGQNTVLFDVSIQLTGTGKLLAAAEKL